MESSLLHSRLGIVYMKSRVIEILKNNSKLTRPSLYGHWAYYNWKKLLVWDNDSCLCILCLVCVLKMPPLLITFDCKRGDCKNMGELGGLLSPHNNNFNKFWKKWATSLAHIHVRIASLGLFCALFCPASKAALLCTTADRWVASKRILGRGVNLFFTLLTGCHDFHMVNPYQMKDMYIVFPMKPHGSSDLVMRLCQSWVVNFCCKNARFCTN